LLSCLLDVADNDRVYEDQKDLMSSTVRVGKVEC